MQGRIPQCATTPSERDSEVMGRTGRRRTLRAFGVIFLVVLAAIVALPLWFPWLLRPVARHYGLNYARYQRKGYSRFELNNVSFTNKTTIVQAERAEGLVPTAWLWKRFISLDRGSYVRVNSWTFRSAPGSNQPKQVGSTYASFRKTGMAAATLKNWLPGAALANGRIEVGKVSLAISEATWRNGQLAADIALPGFMKSNKLDTPFYVTVVPAGKTATRITLNSDSLALQSAFEIAEDGSELKVRGEGLWLSNRFEIQAVFPQSGFLPHTAALRAPSLSLPAEAFRLPQYERVAGSLALDWRTNEFFLNLDARAAPQDRSGVPPITLEAHASGNTQSVRVASARISAPWLQAELSHPTTLRFAPPFLEEPAELKVSADLSRQPWLVTTGRIDGTATVLPDSGRAPRVSFALTGSDLIVTNIHAQSLELQGSFAWPMVEIEQARIAFADGSLISATTALDVHERALRSGHLEFGGTFGRQWLPTNIVYSRAALVVDASGPFKEVAHRGKLVVENLRAPNLRPLNVNAEWNGRGIAFDQSRLTLATTNASVMLAGAADLSRAEKQIAIKEMAFKRGPEDLLRLEKPARILFERNDATGTARHREWVAEVQSLDLRHESRVVHLDGRVAWPSRGNLAALVQGLDSSVLNEFLARPLPTGRIDDLHVTAHWSNAPVEFQMVLASEVLTREKLSFAAKAQVRGGHNGIAVNSLSIASATQAVCTVTGAMPIVFVPTNHSFRLSASDGPLNFEARTEPESVLWARLAEWTGIRLENPEVRIRLAGDWQAPQGQVSARARRVDFSRVKRPLPAMEEFQMALDINHDIARLSRLSLLVEKQPVTVTGEIPFEKDFWRTLGPKRALPDWKKANLHLQIQNAEVAAFTELAPVTLSPQGKLNADVTLHRGQVAGVLTIEDAKTRPLEAFGAIRDINTKVSFEGGVATLESLSFSIGGQPVWTEGKVEFDQEFWSGKSLPAFQVRIWGTNVPIVRKAETLLRADLNLTVTNAAGKTPTVAGAVHFRDSFYLKDLQDLVPGRVASPSRRPPYFSVEKEPWANWRLNVTADGDRFLSVRSPLFRGKASILLRLEGTLKDPIALGEARINSGTVRFPFGNLEVKQGFVTLTSNDPFRPRLFVTAEAQRFGYSVKMQATGPADEPRVEFSSSPPLGSEQIVLMLTTGQMPRGAGIATTGQQRAQTVALFVGKNLLTELGVGNEDEERLTIRSGEQITETGRPTYEAEYKLAEKWSVIGEYDRFNQFNASLKWKVYSR